ncbi:MULTISPECIES: TetR/AcrR family transcriptional regulator [Alteromonas]|jgi:TetR/AcrR family transcriptional regulator of autoinduction and epiphytic fitness|uniref:TetR family transcriptional regulator n=2 Tax=Alteromonas stellipolaris TaxID=233316 RepID=A0AAW7Z6N8_9ALTE|nr:MULTISPECIES: TetR/AcrR family transcriptional regulator [Alteromonas]AMJ90494.1 TetR family transcriptional regulator [Alteromonas sp. Mac2]ALM91198.1 Transcriptional regulator, TetR [Alteromonas stellipolaris LMG 21856]AMJ74202.1 TetR family transcriptional regulator [Alteromonas stellipolaris]AMJ86634.1 TetR family transcriptional regulator [Alteromonas sp. Mac1]AMJ94336.1 TetR family transcriptional regulator [Alteromonas stellipolaris]
MTSTTRTRSDVKRDAIIQAAKHAFQEFGVNGTSMDKLAELANVSKRTVYNHFSAKEELVMHLIKEQWQSALVDIGAPYNPKALLADQLTDLIMADINFMSGDEHLELARVAIGHFFYEPNRLKDEVAQLQAQEKAMHRWLKAAKKDNRMDFDDIDQVVEELDSLVKGQCFWPQLFKLEDPLTEVRKLEIAKSTAALILCRYEVSSEQSA